MILDMRRGPARPALFAKEVPAKRGYRTKNACSKLHFSHGHASLHGSLFALVLLIRNSLLQQGSMTIPTNPNCQVFTLARLFCRQYIFKHFGFQLLAIKRIECVPGPSMTLSNQAPSRMLGREAAFALS